MDRENSSGLMVSHTKAAFIIIVYRERENTIGQTGLPMKGMLSVVCEMDLANLFLQIQMSSTRVSGKMVKGTDFILLAVSNLKAHARALSPP